MQEVYTHNHFEKAVVIVQNYELSKELSRYRNLTSQSLIRALLKGGIPAAPSGTATLLRLSPSYQFYLR